MRGGLFALIVLFLQISAFAQSVSIRELVPSSAPVGARVLVTGRGLQDPALAVSFASGVSATVLQRSDRYIEVVVPATAVTGNVRVTNGATLVKELPFTVTLDPKYTVTTPLGGKDSQNKPLKHPWGAAVVLPEGTVAIADEQHHQIVMLTPAGAVSVLAGDGKQGFKNGKGAAASFKDPRGVAFDATRRVLYVSDSGNSAIREVALDGTVKTLAGDGKQGYKDGTGSGAQFKDPHGLTVGADGAIYVTDSKNNRIRKVTTAGVVTTFAGSGQSGPALTNGALLTATFYEPRAIVAHGNDFYVADTKNNAIRKISGGQVTTVLSFPRSGDADDPDVPGDGNPAVLNRPQGIGVDDAGNLIVSDSKNDFIRKIRMNTTPATMITIAGTGKNGQVDGDGAIAQFKDPVGLTVAGAIYVADEDNDALRRLCPEARVTGLFSPTGAVSAGAEVRVFGTGFVPGGTTVQIGTATATDVTWISSTEMAVKLPQNITGGSVSVTITSCGGTAGPTSFVVDNTPPVLTITNGGAPLVDNSMFKVPVVPVITATDDIDPAPVVTATLNGASFVSGTTVAADGVYTLVANAEDAAGNRMSQTVHFTIDATPPVVQVLEGTAPFPAGFYFNRPVIIDLNVTDLTTTTKDVRIDGDLYVLRQPYAIERDPHTLTVKVTDALGNETVVPPIAFTIDMTAPALTFTSHQNDQTLTGGDVTLIGGSDDSIVVRVDGVDATLDTAAKTFRIARTLLEGENTITASGTDRAGNTGTASLKLNLDTRAPELTVEEVAACTRAESIELRGTVSDPRLDKIVVKIGGSTIAGALAAGRWSATVPLGGEGAKSILIEATDSVQHSATKQVALTVDRTAPAIEIRSGGAAFTANLVARPVSLFLSADDADTNATPTATLDGSAYASGAEISAEGSHTIRVTARDCADNQASREHTFAIDLTAPQFLTFNPASGTKLTTVPPALTGTVSADAVEVRAKGLTVPVTNGTFSIPNILADGVNEIALEVTDRAGHTGSASYTLGIRTNKPLIEIVENGTAMVNGTVYRRTVEPRVRVFEDGVTFTATLDGTPFTNGTQISSDGSYSISATATDSAYGQTNTVTRSFTIDRDGPAVTIVSPANGAVIDADVVDVRVTAGDAVRVSVNGISATKGSDNVWIAANVPLEIGDNLLGATGEDAAGNSGSDSAEVTRGGVGPAIALTFPPNDYVTNRPKLDVTGRVLRPNSSVAVTVPPTSAASAAVDPAGMFRLPGATLTEGEWIITATATEGGRSTSATARVIADFTPPRVRILESNQTLEEGSQFPTQAIVSGEAFDRNQAVNYQLVIDGNTVTPPATVTANGGHTAILTARDAAGNEARLERTFYVGSGGGGGCLLDEESFDPRHNSVVNAQKVELIGRSGGAAGVKVNGVAAKMSNGSFCASVELPQEGANEVTIVCTDADGNPTGQPKTITLYRVTNDPSVTITTPAEDAVTHDETIVVAGTLGNGAVSVEVNSKPATINGTDWTVTDVRLQDGVNVLVARAKNAAGDSAVASRRITYIQDPPAISISSPLAGFVTGAATVDVSGTYSNVVVSSLAIAGLAGAVESTPWSDTTGRFIARNVSLVTGDNTIAVTGSDRTGRIARAEVAIRYLVNTPLISITSPNDNHYFPASEGDDFTVSGTFSGAEGSTVDVNGVAATTSGSTFTADVPFSTLVGGLTPVIARVSQPGSDGAFDSIRVFKLSEGPRVLETFPAADAIEVDPGAVVLVLFSAPMDRDSTVDAFRLENAAGTAVNGKAYLDKDVLTFAPAATLTPGERYTIKVTTAATDLAGQPLTAAVSSAFIVATTAPSQAPTLTTQSGPFCGNLVEVAGTTVPGGRVRLDYGTIFFTTTASATGAFSYKVPLSGQQGYHVIRVRSVGSDGTFSPFVELKLNVDCAGPRVLDASYDRAANRLTIVFSRDVKASTVTSDTIQLVLSDARLIGGTISVAGANVTVTPAENLSEQTFTLKISTGVEDLAGRRLEAPYTRVFSFGSEEPQAGDGRGYITGEVYDATTGRPLAGASITIEAPTSAFVRGPQTNNTATTQAVTMTTDARGRYGDRFPEGAHTIRASATGYTTVWRQIIVPAGAGVIPIDIRLTKRGTPATINGAAALTHGGDKIARRAELTVPAGAVTAGASVTLTATGAQSLAGLLPLGWSPIASAEILSNALTLGASTLTFDVPQSDITSASQSLAAVRYDDSRDEWRVVAAAVNISNGKASLEVTSPGAFALVYADKAPLQVPPAPIAGAPLQGVDDPCANGSCPAMVATGFPLDPAVVLPTESTVATLNIEGTTTHVFPSGTAVQAYIDEELRLVDGGRELDPPFATDLLLYRNLRGDTGVATFRLAPSARAAEVTLEVGFDHIRILAYPGRLDRGTLIGPEGGRVPADDQVAVEIPTGATQSELHASATSLADPQSFGPIAGYTIVGGLQLNLAAANQTPTDLDGDGQPEPAAPVELTRPARATFTVPAQPAGAQLILVELLDRTPFGNRMFRLAAEMQSIDATRWTTKTIDREQLPVDGIIREGRYLLLAPTAPIAFAKGIVRLGAGGPAAADARVSTPTLAVADLSRLTGIFNVPVPTANFQLIPRSAVLGDGTTYTHSSAPAAGAIVNVGDLVIVAQPPQVASTIPSANATNVGLTITVEVTFAPGIDPTSVNAGSLSVIDTTNGNTIPGAVTAVGNLGIRWTQPSGETLRQGTRYAVAVASSVRGINGTPLGQAYSFSFTTVAVVPNAEVHPERIRITMPDANGQARIIGDAGALKADWVAVPTRRGNDFRTRYSVQAATDGSFTLTIGTDARDRITIADEIDLRVLNNAGALAAVIPLTPFVSEDGKAFVAPKRTAVTFTSVEGIRVAVPAGAFDVATLVAVQKAEPAVFGEVPRVFDELDIVGAVSLQFEGRARERLQVTIPVPANVTPANGKFILGWLGMSTRGPRIQAQDELFAASGALTTTRPDGGSNVSANIVDYGTNAGGVTRGNGPGDMMQGMIEGGAYAAFQFKSGVADNGFVWALLNTQATVMELYWDTLFSLWVGHQYAAEFGTVVFPVPADRPFRVTGVDPATSLTVMDQPFNALPVGAPGTVTVLPTPENDLNGPHPVYGSPIRIESAEVPPVDVTVEAVRNVKMTVNDSGILTLAQGAPFASPTRVSALDVQTGERRGPQNLPFTLPNAKPGHRIVLAFEEHEVDPSTPVSIVFNEPIDLGSATGGDEEAISDFLKDLIKLEQATDPSADGVDVLQGAILRLDSGGRRVNFLLPSPLAAGQQYRLTIKKDVQDLSGNDLLLGQAGEKDSSGNVVATGPAPEEMVFWFKTRGPHGAFAAFDIRQSDSVQAGYIREIARYDNLLFVAAVDGGILAYDISDPEALDASLNPKPVGFAPGLGTGSVTAYWNVQVDHHGRVITTGMGNMFGALRTFRVEDFINARSEPGCNADYDNEVCNQTGGGMVSQNPGSAYTAGLHSAAVATDRVEAIPRKVRVVVGDLPPVEYTRDAFIALATSVSGPADGLQVIQAEIPPSAPMYRIQRITVENVTLGLRWSADAKAVSDAPDLPKAKFKNIVAGPNDVLRVTHNLTTHAVVTLFGYGIGVFDVNAFESNDRPQVPGSEKPMEQVALKANAFSPPQLSDPQKIADLAYMTDGAIAAAPSGSLRVYNTDARRGVIEFATVLPSSMYLNGQTIFTAGNPRFDALKAAANTAGLTSPNVRFNSVALYRNTTTSKDYLLVPANDLGLFVLEAGAIPLSQDSFADVIWFPRGAYGVSVVERSNLALVVDGKGAVLLVDLSRLDEREAMVAGAPLAPDALFPTAAGAIGTAGAYGYGSPDPRILWRSAEGVSPGNIPPVMDPETGMFYTGELLAKKVQAGSAIDPRTRIVADYGDGKGPREVSTVVPFGIKTPDNVLKCKIADDPDNCRATLGAFRVEIALPGSIEESLTDDLAVAVESERLAGVVAPQTPDLLPPAHVRIRRPDGTTDPRGVTGGFKLHRVLDVPSAPELRYQRGWNRFVSDWVVAIADPRASKQYDSSWGPATTPEKKEDLGCFSCVRPKSITDDPDAKEMLTAGRFIAVRPEITPGSGPYSWLGENRRLRTRVSTTMTDTVRPANVLIAAQNPPVATGMIQETIFLHSGEVETSAVDLDAGGRAGWNVVFDRTYRSRTLGRTPLGFGWDSAIFKRLRALPTGDVEYRDGSGEVFLYRVQGGEYVSPKGHFYRLAPSSDGGWVMTDQKRRLTYFDAYGRVVREGDEFYTPDGKGNQTIYVYDGEDRLEAIVDATDRVSRLDYYEGNDGKTGLLKEVLDWRSPARKLEYKYDAVGRLETAVLPQFTQYGGGPITPERKYKYDVSTGGSYANTLELSTNLISMVEPNESSAETARVTYSYSGGPRDYVRTEKWASPGLEETKFEFTTGTAPTAKTTDVLGQVRNYTFKMPVVPPADKKLDWYSQDRVHVDTMEEVDVEIFSDADFGALPASIEAGTPNLEDKSRQWKFTYNEEGLMETSTLAGVSVSRNTYIPAGPGLGQLLQCAGVGAAGSNPCGGSASAVETTYNYDGTYLKSITSNGETIETPEPHRGVELVTETNNQVTSQTKFDLATGLPVEVTTSGGNAGDPTNSKIVVTYPSSPSAAPYKRGLPERIEIGTGALKTTYTYLSQDRTLVDDGRNTTDTSTDEWRRPVSVKVTNNDGDPLSIEESFKYDATGRVKERKRKQTTGAGAETVTTTHEYDIMGRLTSLKNDNVDVNGSDSSVTETTDYSQFHSGTIKSDPPGPSEITTTIDSYGRPKETKHLYESGKFIVTSTAYDLAGNVVYTSDGKDATAYAFDAAGRTSDVLELDGSKQKLHYDGWNRLAELKLLDSAGTDYYTKTTSYTPAGSVLSATDTAGGLSRTVTNQWDAAGRLVRIASTASGAMDAGRAVSMKFDDADRLLSSEAGEGTVAGVTQIFDHVVRTSYNDTMLPGRVEETEPKTATPITYRSDREFDTLGQLKKVVINALQWNATWDQQGRMVQGSVPGRPTAQYEYDSRGRLLRELQPDGSTKTHQYNDTGAKVVNVDEEAEQTKTEADYLGRTTKLIYADETTEVFQYDGPRLDALKNRQDLWQSFHYNEKGQMAEVWNTETPQVGVMLDEVKYDDAGRLKSWKNKDSLVEYSDFTLDDMPELVKQTRYKDGSGFSGAPVVLDTYTVSHVFNGYGEMTELIMPGSPAAGFFQKLNLKHDAMGNLVEVKRDGEVLLTGEYRNASRPDTRTVHIKPTGCTDPACMKTLLRSYTYNSDTSQLDGMKVTLNGMEIAGSKVTHGNTLQITEQKLYGVSDGDRYTRYSYDARGRLFGAVTGVADSTAPPQPPTPAGGSAAAAAPGVGQQLLSPASFRNESQRTPKFDATAREELRRRGIDPDAIDPPGATATPRPGHKINGVTKGSTTHSFQWTRPDGTGEGAVRTEDGRFRYGYDEKQRLIWVAEKAVNTVAPIRRVLYAYDGNGRMVGRTAQNALPSTISAPVESLTWQTETRLEVIAVDGVPAEMTFVWDFATDRLVSIFKAGDSASASDPNGNLLKQFIHGDLGLDDPIEVTTLDAVGVIPPPGTPHPVTRLFPVYDEAGNRTLQVVVNRNGEVVGRSISTDPYSGEEFELAGAAVDRVEITARKDSAGALESVRVLLHATEALDASTISAGTELAVVKSNGAVTATSSVIPEPVDNDPYAVAWDLTAAQWSDMIAIGTAAGGVSISVAATDELRASAWAIGVPVLPAPDWAEASGAVYSSSGKPVEIRAPVAIITNFITAIGNGDEDTTTPYEVQALGLLGVSGGSGYFDLLAAANFHAQPFADVFTGKNYVRARWFDPETGTWLTPDPSGDADSSNLYAFADGDPVNKVDPTGERVPTAEDVALGLELEQTLQEYDQAWQDKCPPRYVKYRLWPVPGLYAAGTEVPLEWQAREFTATTEKEYLEGRQILLNDIATFQAAVKKADDDGDIYYVPNPAQRGFQTITREQAASAERWNNVMNGAGVLMKIAEVFAAKGGRGGGARARTYGRRVKKNAPPKQTTPGPYNVRVGNAHPTGSGVDKKRHNANIRLFDENGKQIDVWRERSGGMTPEQLAMRFPYGPKSSHTEAKALTRYRLKPGQKLVITGQKPPCKQGVGCNTIMRQAATESGATIIYQWREGGRTMQQVYSPK